MDTTEASRKPAWSRLVWFAGIWAASVATMFALAAAIRFWIA